MAEVVDRELALGQMPPQLRQLFDRIEARMAEQATSVAYRNWEIGELLSEIDVNEDAKFGVMPLDLVCKARRGDARFFRKLRQCVGSMTRDQFTELLQAAGPDANGFQIHWGHIEQLLSLPNHRTRLRWARQAARTRLDPSALADQIAHASGRTPGSGHGRRHEMPETLHLQIKQMHDKTADWLRRYETVWDGPDLSVMNNLQNCDPTDLMNLDLQRLHDLNANLVLLEANATAFKTRLQEVVRAIDAAVIAQSTADAEAVAEAQAEQRRQPRRTRQIMLPDDTE